MSNIVNLPRSQPGGCCRGDDCVGDGSVNIYEAGLQDTPDGLLCGACARADERRRGRDPRAIDKHFKWRPGHDPSDDEADPNSPFVYLNLEPTEVQAPVSDKSRVLGGVPSGTPCFNCLAKRGRTVETRLAEALDPYSLLEPTGYRQAEGTQRTKEKVIMTICPVCTSVTQWREEEFKRARSKNDFK